MYPSSNKEKKLLLVAKEIAISSPCPLRKHARHAVPGEGNANADIVFIGEAPGKQEDRTGKPFVGAAGTILLELLQSIQYKRSDVFITSIEKFRPPQNRPPNRTEILACFPYLEKQLAIIQPTLIVPLGRYALQRMLEWEEHNTALPLPSIGSLHGKIYTGRSGRRYYPLHHPAAALYNRTLLETLHSDIQRIPHILKKLKR